MATYHFVTEFRIRAAQAAVWAAIDDTSTWPSWWTWLKAIETLDPGGADGLGARHRLSFRTALPYTLAFESTIVRIVRPTLLESRAAGELTGTGLWELSADGEVTLVRYTWIVETTKRWMNLLAPVARPAFSWNHDRLMRDFATGLAGHLDAELVSVTNRTVSPRSPEFGRLPEGSAA